MLTTPRGTDADRFLRFDSARSGGRDYLVLTEPLLERLEKHEKDVRVLRVQKLDEGEHCDFFW